MASLFPAALDSFENPTPSTAKDAAGQLRHSTQHAQMNDAMAAVQGTLGVAPAADAGTVANRIGRVEVGYLSVKVVSTTSYTLTSADAGTLIEFTNASAIALTVPNGVFSAGERVDLVCTGDGLVTVNGSGGATLHAAPSAVV